MRKLAHLFTDLLLGPPPSSIGAASTAHVRAEARDRHAPVAEVIVVDQADHHLDDFLELFPTESAEVPAARPRQRPRLGA